MSWRLRHPTLTDVNFTVVHYRPYPVPYLCPACGEAHRFKTYHLRLDAAGEVVVSDTIYERLAELDGLPLKTVGKEAHPKPITIDMQNGAGPQTFRTEAFVPRTMRDAVNGSGG